MRKATLACLAVALGASLALPSVAPAQEFPPASRFQKVTLNDRPGEPMALAVLPDGRVLHSARTGEIRIHNPKTGLNTMAADMREAPAGLYQHDEEGVQGIALDPNFAQNKWVYVYYSPRLNTPVDVPGTRHQRGRRAVRPRRRRRTARGSRCSRAPSGSRASSSRAASSTSAPSRRSSTCRSTAASAATSAARSTSTARATSTSRRATTRTRSSRTGYSPIDERSNRNPAFDAQRTSANTNDLRGKILRIRVRANGGGYSIPAGNLFRPGTARTKPEIYAMGFRNPFRMAVDQQVEQRLRGRLLA